MSPLDPVDDPEGPSRGVEVWRVVLASVVRRCPIVRENRMVYVESLVAYGGRNEYER